MYVIMHVLKPTHKYKWRASAVTFFLNHSLPSHFQIFLSSFLPLLYFLQPHTSVLLPLLSQLIPVSLFLSPILQSLPWLPLLSHCNSLSLRCYTNLLLPSHTLSFSHAIHPSIPCSPLNNTISHLLILPAFPFLTCYATLLSLCGHMQTEREIERKIEKTHLNTIFLLTSL